MLETDENTPETLKRLNLNLPQDRFSRVQNLAKKRGITVAELVRYALGLIEQAYAEVSDGNKIAVLDSRNQIIKQFVLPW